MGTGNLFAARTGLPFAMTPPQQHPTPRSSHPSSGSEKLLRDALLRDEWERQQHYSPPITPRAHRRRHSHSTEDYARGSFLFRTPMSNPRSPSPAPSRHTDFSPVRRMLFDLEGRQDYHQQTRRCSPSPSRHSSASSSPSPSPLHMKRRQEAHTTTSTFTNPTSPTNDIKLRRNLSLHSTPHRCGSVYPSQSHQGEPLQISPHEQVLQARLERVLTVSGFGPSTMPELRGDENQVRDEEGGWPWRRGRQSSGSGSGSAISTSFNTSSSPSISSHSHQPQPQPHTAQAQSRAHHPISTPNWTTQTADNQPSPYYSPSSPRTPFSAPAGGSSSAYPPPPSHNRTRSRTDPPPSSHSNLNSSRKNGTTPSSSPPLPPPVTLNSEKLTRLNSKSIKKSPLPLSLGDGEAEARLRLPTPPPSPPFAARIPSGYVPSPYKKATASPNPSDTTTRIPVRSQSQTRTQRKKVAELEIRRPTQGPVVPVGEERGKDKEPLGPLDVSSQQQGGGQRLRRRDATITQQSQQALRLSTDGHSLASTESGSTRTSECSASHSHASGYCACSSHSSLDKLPQGDLYHPPNPAQSRSNPSSPTSPNTTKPFNARKASTQCRAIQGYVSFASVEGLGEPPSLAGDEFDGEGSGCEGGGKGNGGKGVLGVWSAAMGWKKFLGGGRVEGQEPGVVVA